MAGPARALRAVADRGNPVLSLDPGETVGAHPRRAAKDRGREGRDRPGGAHGRRHERAGAPLRRRRKGGRLRQAPGRSRGGFGSKLHLMCDRRGRPMALVLTPGEHHEQTASRELVRRGAVERQGPGRPKLRPRSVTGDKGYTGRPVRDCLRRHGMSAVIPQLRTERTPRLMARGLHRERNWVERLVGQGVPPDRDPPRQTGRELPRLRPVRRDPRAALKTEPRARPARARAPTPSERRGRRPEP